MWVWLCIFAILPTADNVRSENYQDPDRSENDATIPGSGPDITQDLLEVGTSCSDEVFNMDPILKVEWVWIVQSWESWLSLPWINDQSLWHEFTRVSAIQRYSSRWIESSRIAFRPWLRGPCRFDNNSRCCVGATPGFQPSKIILLSDICLPFHFISFNIPCFSPYNQLISPHFTSPAYQTLLIEICFHPMRFVARYYFNPFVVLKKRSNYLRISSFLHKETKKKTGKVSKLTWSNGICEQGTSIISN